MCIGATLLSFLEFSPCWVQKKGTVLFGRAAIAATIFPPTLQGKEENALIMHPQFVKEPRVILANVGGNTAEHAEG